MKLGILSQTEYDVLKGDTKGMSKALIRAVKHRLKKKAEGAKVALKILKADIKLLQSAGYAKEVEL